MFDLNRLAPASRQCLFVWADTWLSTTGTAQCAERRGAAWHFVGPAFPVSLGRHGLAWGCGLHGGPPAGIEVKQEGDGKAPVGVFAIGALFGRLADPLVQGFRLPYRRVHPGLKAVDDPASAYYNRVVALAEVSPDWASAEDMLRPDARYDLGAMVGHNTAPVLPGKGSCIFLHVWEAPGVPTAGCTAMAYDDMARLAAWFDPSSVPLLCQMVRTA